jgi:flagellar hook-length control protein FliK
MNNVCTIEVAARAAAPPKKTEGVKTPKGDEGFKECLITCGQEAKTEQEAEKPVEEAVMNAAGAAVMVFQMLPVQAETSETVMPDAHGEPVIVAAAMPQPMAAEMPAEGKAEVKPETHPGVKAEASVESAPVQAGTTPPVKAETKVDVSSFQANLNAADDLQKVDVQAPPAPKPEAVPIVPVQAKNTASEAAVEGKPVVKVQSVEVVEAESPTTATENVTARISVDLTKASAEARPAQLSQYLGAEIATAVAAGKSSIHIQIQPENMGRINVRLVSNSDGMQVILTTESAATGKLLENNLSQLQKSLSEAGLTVSGLSVNSQGLQGQFSNSFQEQKSFPTQRFVNRTTVAAMPVEAIAANYSSRISGLDFRI